MRVRFDTQDNVYQVPFLVRKIRIIEMIYVWTLEDFEFSRVALLLKIMIHAYDHYLLAAYPIKYLQTPIRYRPPFVQVQTTQVLHKPVSRYHQTNLAEAGC
eukprot:SAG31_NODE_8382_length_1463_cov_1.064516_2_plen_101_part_00